MSFEASDAAKMDEIYLMLRYLVDTPKLTGFVNGSPYTYAPTFEEWKAAQESA